MKKLLTIFLMIIFTVSLAGCNEQPTDETPTIEKVKTELTLDNVLDNTTLPTEIDGISISWQSSKPDLVSSNGVITKPAVDVSTILTAVLTDGDRVMTKIFDVIILGEVSADYDKVQKAVESVSFEEYEVIDDLPLFDTLDGDITVLWSSSNSDVISSTGEVTRPEADSGDALVTMTMIATYNDVVIQKDFVFTVIDLSQTVVYIGYYAGADDLFGEALKAFLHELINDHTVISYSQVSEALKVTDLDPNNSENIILLYSGASIDKDNRCSSSCPSGSWNKEHVWPQSLGNFNTGDAPGTDLHALRPTYVSINSIRASLDFDYDDGTGTEIYYNGIATGNYYDSNSFEPRDEIKGDIARMIFYMAVRYEGDDGFADLEIDNMVGDGAPTIGVLAVLLEWNLNDLPDEFEMHRNEVIFGIQHNRNPFIDHPEFATLIWGTL